MDTSNMNFSRHERSLELNKILEKLAKQCPCPQCAEMAMQLRPSKNLSTVRQLMQQTNDAHMLTGRFGSPSMGGIKDIVNSLARAQAGGSLSMRELLDIASVLSCIRTLSDWYSNVDGVKTSLDGLFSSLYPNKYLETLITTSIKTDDELFDNASSELNDIRRKIRLAGVRVREQLDKLIRSTSYQKYLQEPIVTIRSDRFVVPVKIEHKNDVPGLVHDTSSSGATVFVEPMAVVETNNQIKILRSREEAEIAKILAKLSAETASFADSIKSNYDILLELGLIFAKARLGYDMKATVPEISDNGIIDLKKARHPLIDPKQVVATDITLGDKFDTLVITGPNTGGKTVALKTIGLLTLMTMCGLMIPVSDQSKISVFDNILADIGDEQSIEQSLSTFSAHMTNIIGILSKANGSCLVLIDELGAGTDPVEGAALAVAILEHLRSKGAIIAATTHYAELKEYALQTNGVENGCCEFDITTLRPTYRLLIGIPGRSNAFAISERLGLELDIVDRARELVSSDNRRFEEVVQKLEDSRQQMEEQNRQAQKLRAQAVAKSREAEAAIRRVREQCDKEIEQAKKQAQTIVERTRAQAAMMLNELEEIKKQQNSDKFGEMTNKAAAQFRNKMNKLEDAADPVSKKTEPKKYKLPRKLKVGDDVLIFDIDKKAVVLSLPDKSDMVEVQAGIIKTRVPLDNLRLLTDATPEQPNRAQRRAAQSSHDGHQLTMQKRLGKVQNTLDLRGKNTEEALSDLDLFIDAAQMSGIQTVTIIHGKGTGVLRTAVGQHLKRHPSIRTFRLGQYGEGETGVTIAEIR